ncbi:MAG: sigma 54-interacting transcriptional regulator [Deltaproteobacteria bacterium]|nr:sigma 54-interacting transcriptional regulator [Deltaproteobacteria bacterium]
MLLICHHGGAEAVGLRPQAPVVVGRELPADVVIDDPTLSHCHARFTLAQQGVAVEDLGSHNGTFVGGERVERATVQPGGELALGQVVVRVLAAQHGSAARLGLYAHDRLCAELGQEIERARFFGDALSVVHVRAAPRGAPESHLARWIDRVSRKLRPVDRLAGYGSEAVHLLLPRLAPEQAFSLCKAIVRPGASGEASLRCGLASFPAAAGTADDLLAACRRAALEADERVPLRLAAAGWASEGKLDDHFAPAAQRGPVVQSEIMRRLFETVDRIAATVIPVLICGETGTGKEVVARAIHERGPRRERRLVCINCAAIPAQLVESTLFGHERGAFTGATQQHRGVFESAHGGTVMLDEVGELPAPVQAALLRVLETKRVTRVGASSEIEVDVRVVAATNADLGQMCVGGRFRRDLLYRLEAMTLIIPPLRERRAEIPALARLFLEEASRLNGCAVRGIDDEALAVLGRYDWPGNVRELRNVVDRAVVLARGALVTVEDLPAGLRRGASAPAVADRTAAAGGPAPGGAREPADLKAHLQRCEAEHIVAALRAVGWNQSEAARLLGIPRRTLVHKIKAFGIKKLGYGLAGGQG